MNHNPSTGSTRPEPEAEQPTPFGGFEMPDQNWSKLPPALIEALPIVETVGELKVLPYVLRHARGFQEFGLAKRFTLDEVQHGRKRRDGSRLDGGTGLSLNGIKDGVRRAVAHGFLVQEVEHRRDRGRRLHLFRLRMSNPDTLRVRIRYPGGQRSTP
jgi:hypothetical protein